MVHLVEDDELWEGKLLCWSRGGVRFNVGLYPASKKDVLPYPARFEHHREPPLDYPAYGVKWFQETYPWGRRYAGLGFEWISQTGKGERLFFPNTLIRSVTLPLYFPTLVFALLPTHNFLRTRRRRRRGKCIAQNHCRACNYDLRASPDRCPECGLAVPAPSKADLKN